MDSNSSESPESPTPESRRSEQIDLRRARLRRLYLTLSAAILGAGVTGAAVWLYAPEWMPWVQRQTSPAAVFQADDGAHSSMPANSAAGRYTGQDLELAVVRAELQGELASFRKIIVLMLGDEQMPAEQRGQAVAIGQAMFHDRLSQVERLDQKLKALIGEPRDAGMVELSSLLDYIESDPDLYDADRLAFRETLAGLRRSLSAIGTLPAVKLHKRVSEDLDALSEIEKNYNKELGSIFGRFEPRAIVSKRERWEDYVAKLTQRYSREQVMKEYGVIMPYTAEQLAEMDHEGRLNNNFGQDLPPKTLVLTFDDGPHASYTEEIEAILQQYDVPGVFFEIGRNLGSVDDKGLKLSANSNIARKLITDGFVIGNHTYTHAALSRVTGDALTAEINNTDALLRAVDQRRSPLFRFPYGARSVEALQLLHQDNLQSVLWNVDSLDWADPVPASIVQRVIREVEAKDHGIILFHDIHSRSVQALPQILDRLIAEGYQFAGWDGQTFSVPKNKANGGQGQAITTGYAQSWAIIVGIDDYEHWPHLQYAVHDAESMRDVLTQRFGFTRDHVVFLKNGEATRNGILSVFHDKLENSGMGVDDRVLVFFAGHGATRHLSSGRDLGYIVPADAQPDDLSTDAIAMTELQNIADELPAKHVFFIMDSCYSGLGLTRGGGFLRENAKRIGRQMLTAGGADQLVADGGPDGHSIFTWTLLQGLAGKGDLNGDGLITATELAAYVAPAVAAVSSQTPAFGSLQGSQGGEFVFQLPVEAEFLSETTSQLAGDALALNNRLESMRPTHPSVVSGEVLPPVVVPDLQGRTRELTTPAVVVRSARQLAQRANDRGLQLYRERRYSDAEVAFTEALKLRPDFALAANNLGYVYFKQAKYNEAIRWLEASTKLDSSRAIAYLNLGDAKMFLGDTHGAESAYKTYLELAPNGAGTAHAKDALGRFVGNSRNH